MKVTAKLGRMFAFGKVSFRDETTEPPRMGSWRVPEANIRHGARLYKVDPSSFA